MGIRTLSSLVALPILFGIIYLGGPYIAVGGFLITMMGLTEFYTAFKDHTIKPIAWAGYVSITLLYGCAWFWDVTYAFSLSVFVMMSAMMVQYLFSSKMKLEDVGVTLIGVLYIGFNLHHIVRIAVIDTHFYIWYIFILAWGTDTCAYFAGYFFGKNKLWEEISPKKTIEGAIGGVVGATLLAVLFAFWLNRAFVPYAIPLGIVGSVLSQIGDLMASKIKRYVNIKDYGHIMPGHGGVLDRFDSIILTAPLVYYYIKLLNL